MNRAKIIHKINVMKKQLAEYKSVAIYAKNKEVKANCCKVIQRLEKKIAFYVNIVGDVGKYDNENFKRKRDYKYK